MKRLLFIFTGIFFVGLGGLGIIIPGLPTTPLLLVAATCFAKSSPRLYNWLLNNYIFGPLIKNWRETRSIPKKVKRLALGSIIVVGGTSIVTVSYIYLKLLIAISVSFPIIFLYNLQETETTLAKK